MKLVPLCPRCNRQTWAPWCGCREYSCRFEHLRGSAWGRSPREAARNFLAANAETINRAHPIHVRDLLTVLVDDPRAMVVRHCRFVASLAWENAA